MKNVKLTESQLINLIKKVIIETEEDTSDTGDCTINCMPTAINRSDSKQTARANCCADRDETGKRKLFGEKCMYYITTYRKDLQTCGKITFTD
jgi:hypothetical protein